MPASGKSTFLRNSPLKNYVIETDELRKLVSTPQINYTADTEKISIGINNNINKKIWDMVYTLAEDRMKQGETIAIDATFLFKSPFSEIRKLCRKYNYRLVTIDFIHTGLTFQQLLDRDYNLDRTYDNKTVGYEVMSKFYARQQALKIPNWWNMIKPEELKMSLSWHLSNVDEYNKVFITGDVHSCYTVLNEAFKENDPIDHPNNLYVFLGDYLDRGTKPVETFNWFYNRMNLPNVVLIRGNHEYHLEHLYQGLPVTNAGSRKETIPALFKAGYDKEDLKRFIKKLQDVYFIEYRGVKYLLSHAGVPTTPEFLTDSQGLPLFRYRSDLKGLAEINLLDESVFTKGIGAFQINLEEYNKEYSDGEKYPVQIHGHRNVQLNKAVLGNTINLEQQVEAGGNLAMVELSNEGPSINLYKNSDYDYVYATESANIDLSQLTNEEVQDVMKRTPDIRQKRDPSGLTSNNFTREAFYGDRFNSFSVTARGLFTDGSGQVQLRGFNKFFVLDQRPETSYNNIIKRAKFPALVAKKYDGHLSLLGWYNGPRMFTKNGTTSLAKKDWKVFRKYLYDTNHYESLMQWLQNNPEKTILMEAINEKEDSHLIDTNGKVGFVLLEIVDNSYEASESVHFDISNHDLSEVEHRLIGKSDNCYVKTAAVTRINSIEELKNIINEAKSSNLTEENTTNEGWVVTFRDGFKFKIKNYYFLALKEARGKLEIALDNPIHYWKPENWKLLVERSYNPMSRLILNDFKKRVPLKDITKFTSHKDGLGNLDLPVAFNSIGLTRQQIMEMSKKL